MWGTGSSSSAYPYSTITSLKNKDLVGIPWRVALALQADGWYLRSDIIWHKPNPMPESVRDRPTRAHEYLFLLTKRERYYYDAQAVREPATPQQGLAATFRRAHSKRAVVIPGQFVGTHRPNRKDTLPADTRNRRSVWTLATRPFAGAHFATFPPALVEPCILAGCPPRGWVLDPFLGSGTTAQVALQHGRRACGIELNPAYLELARQRLAPWLLEAAA
jgi:DNA modification methylase